MIQLEGIVTRASRGYGEREYSVTDGASDFLMLSREYLSPGTPISVEGELDTTGKIIAKRIILLHTEAANKVLTAVSAKVKSNVKLATNASSELLVSDDFTSKLIPQMRELAIELLCAKKLARQISLRFHGDADGIAGAIALSSVIYCKTFQQNSAVYTVRDALRDIESAAQEIGHLMVFVDFGSNEASLEGIRFLKAAGFQLIIIDHHPYVRESEVMLLNPLEFDPDGLVKASKYTAGYMACEIAVICGLDRGKAFELAHTACAGDKSTILPVSQIDIERAMVIDFVASHSSFGNKLEFYKNVLAKKDLFDSIAKQAEEEISFAAQKAMKGMKQTETGTVSVYTFSLEKIVTRGEWPPSSKVTTRVYETLNSQQNPPDSKPIICIAYTDRTVILRLNDPAVALGLSANTLATKLKTTMADFVLGGGGHVKAGAIKTEKGFTKEVVGELVREIEDQINGSKK